MIFELSLNDKKCPRCNSSDIRVHSAYRCYLVECEPCGKTTSYFASVEEAEKAWDDMVQKENKKRKML